MKTFKQFTDNQITERVWYDSLMAYIGRTVFSSDEYEDALKTLLDVIKRKKANNDINHNIDYYANAVARTYAHVDSRELADMYREVFPKQK